MSNMGRREFLKVSTKLCALMGLAPSAIPEVAEALQQLASGTFPILWLQGQSCAGCSVSILNSVNPGPAEILTKYISLLFHPTLSAATGAMGMEIVHRVMKQEGFLLAVEGSMPEGMPRACMMGHEPVTELVARAAEKAKAVIAVGACASFGGIPHADNNPTGAVSVPAFLKKRGVSTPVVTLPGCPCHPDWFVGTVIYILKFGFPALDDRGRPSMFFSKLIHEQCPRFRDYEREIFAKNFSEEGCLFKLGCCGPSTYADCTLRLWNSGTNMCIHARGPCIGCASEEFAVKTDFPFYTKNTYSKVAID